MDIVSPQGRPVPWGDGERERNTRQRATVHREQRDPLLVSTIAFKCWVGTAGLERSVNPSEKEWLGLTPKRQWDRSEDWNH